MNKSNMYRVYEEEEEIISDHLVKLVIKTKKEWTKSDVLKLIIQASKNKDLKSK